MADKKEKFKKAFWEQGEVVNPALMFISAEPTEEPQATTAEPPQDHHETTTEPQAEAIGGEYVVRHKKIVNSEVKTKRVQLVFRPSTHKKAIEKAAELELSLSEYIHSLIEQDTTQ